MSSSVRGVVIDVGIAFLHGSRVDSLACLSSLALQVNIKGTLGSHGGDGGVDTRLDSGHGYGVDSAEEGITLGLLSLVARQSSLCCFVVLGDSGAMGDEGEVSGDGG